MISHAKIPVILDMDTGVDDALAIMLALSSPELDVKAITVSGGNISAIQCALNTVRIVQAYREHTRSTDSFPLIAKGYDPKKCGGATEVMGKDGLGGFSKKLRFRGEGKKINIRNAAYIVRTILEQAIKTDEPVTLVTTAPLTNPAKWIKSFPELMRSGVQQIVTMGGAFFTCGNVEPVAEFNIWADSKSAAKVLDFCRNGEKSGKRNIPMTFVGLDVTEKLLFRETELMALLLEYPDNKLLTVVRGITETYMRFCIENESSGGCALHDPAAVGFVIAPHLFTTRRFHVEIETDGKFTRGMTVADGRNRKLKQPEITKVCVDVDKNGFEHLFMSRLLQL